MLSALKKLTINNTNRKQDGENNINVSSSQLQTMPRVLQNKFSRGIQYNMKIIIKGDRNVGKSCLFNRLQGRNFIETYVPTEEIQVTSIQWNYKATNDIVKVEVWDVVDKGKKRILSSNLKLMIEDCEKQITPALDAEFLNVYKHTNGVILMMDITKNWTFEYVQRELEKIPTTIPVLVLGNHCDMSHHRCVTPDHVLFYIENLKRSSPTRYAESSMYNGFGLKFIHKWFNLPFLQLQKETLLAQLVTNENEINITTQELDLYQQTDDSNYKLFLEKLTSRRRKTAESNSLVPSSSIIIQTQHNFSSTDGEDALSNKITNTEMKSVKNNESKSCNETLLYTETDKNINSIVCDKKSKTSELLVSSKLDTIIKNIEEFIPDEHLDKSFLEEAPVQVATTKTLPTNDSDSDLEITTNNPLVSAFQDDLDPEDVCSYNEINNLESKENNLKHWVISESRGSPDGGDDVSKCSDTKLYFAEDTSSSSSGKTRKKKNIKKKKVDPIKTDNLENFFNSDYEAL